MLDIGLPWIIENEICKHLRIETSKLSDDYNRVVEEYKEKLEHMEYFIEQYKNEYYYHSINDDGHFDKVDFVVLPLIYSEYFFESVKIPRRIPRSIYLDDYSYSEDSEDEDENYYEDYTIQVIGHNGLEVSCVSCDFSNVLSHANRNFDHDCVYENYDESLTYSHLRELFA
jgi:hypothetical protein